ncbi:MAG: phospholipid scramblase-related protein [Phycisphaerae bacterium]
MTEVAADQEALIIQQRKEWGEILTGFECKNKYAILDQQGQQLMMAAEVGSGILSRLFLKQLRPWTIHVTDNDANMLLHIKRSFRFFFHEAEIQDAGGQVLGRIKRQWSWVRRIYKVFDAAGQERFTLFGPVLHPWTFNILRGQQEMGKITKKWSGLGKEIFTKADNFGLTYSAGLGDDEKDLLLGAVFLIDFVHFEQSNN